MTEKRYEITKLLGKGRTGGVYEAEDTNLGRKVALRRFFAQSKQTDLNEYKTDFEKVAHSLSALQHPNLLRVYDAGADGDGPYIISQLLNGEIMNDIISKNGQMPVWEVNDLAQQMLDALSTAHEKGFVHGAITPDSILLTSRARGGYLYVILDMGLSRLAPLIQGKDSILSVMADPAILAPELFDGGAATEQGDLYMLGQILFMALAGGHPFGGVPAKAAEKMHQEGLPSLRQFVEDIPEDFRLWIEMLTQIDPANRPASAIEALNALPRIGRPAISHSTDTQTSSGLINTGSAPQSQATGINPGTSDIELDSLSAGVTAAVPKSATDGVGILKLPEAEKDSKILIFIGVGVLVAAVAVSLTLSFYKNNTAKIEVIPELVPNINNTAKIKPAPKTGSIFTEDFERWDGATSVKIVDSGTITSSNRGNFNAFVFSNRSSTDLMRPVATGSGWIDPIPSIVGKNFIVLFAGNTATADLADTFADNVVYRLTFDQFKRGDVAGDSVTARIMDGTRVLATKTFSAVTFNNTIIKRTLSYTTSGGSEVGKRIRLQLSDSPGPSNPPQVAIDNVKLEATKAP